MKYLMNLVCISVITNVMLSTFSEFIGCGNIIYCEVLVRFVIFIDL